MNGKSLDRTNDLNDIWVKSGKKMRTNHCFYPGCESKETIKSHVFQNNGVLNLLSENGYVFMPKQKNKDIIPRLVKFGRKEATVFKGFCGLHDKQIFQPIEDVNWKIDPNSVFLFTYRTFVSQLQAKMDFDNRFKIISRELDSHNDNEILDGVKKSLEDFNHEKNFFDKYLINGGKSPLNYIAWTIRTPIKFAVSGFETPYIDFDGHPIQNWNARINHHIFFTILPHNGYGIAIISWLKTDDKLFKAYTRELRKLSETKRKQYLSNKAILVSDDLILSPLLVEKLTKMQIQQIEGEYLGTIQMSEMFGMKSSERVQLEDSGLNLFNF